jgi:hypothetical protein
MLAVIRSAGQAKLEHAMSVATQLPRKYPPENSRGPRARQSAKPRKPVVMATARLAAEPRAAVTSEIARSEVRCEI